MHLGVLVLSPNQPSPFPSSWTQTKRSEAATTSWDQYTTIALAQTSSPGACILLTGKKTAQFIPRVFSRHFPHAFYFGIFHFFLGKLQN